MDKNTLKCLEKFRPLLKFDEIKLKVYVLVNFNTTLEEDLERIYKLKELRYDPYVMRYNKHLMKKGNIYNKLARWVNNKIFK